MLKPDITFFGQGVGPKVHSTLKQDFPKADLVIVLGTSLKIAPMVSTLRCFKQDAVQVYVVRARPTRSFFLCNSPFGNCVHAV